MTNGGDRRVLLDASAFITLAAIDAVDLFDGLPGTRAVPEPVVDEIREDPAASALETAVRDGRIERPPAPSNAAEDAARGHLGNPRPEGTGGDVALLASAIDSSSVVVVTDDKPLRQACKALGVPISGSIGVVIAAVERGEVAPDEARELLVAMDEVGARLSASLLRRAERLIDDAADRS